MARWIHVATAAIVAALPFLIGADPAAAGPGDASASMITGWVIENPRADGFYDTHVGSASIGVASGAAISCPLTGGWGRASSGTVRPNDSFASTGLTIYGGCTGPGGEGLEVISSPDMVFGAEIYDAEADRITGSSYVWVWGLFLNAPDCQADLYPPDPNVQAPLTYDNRTATLETGPVVVVVTRADGPGCAGLAEVGDQMTFETTFVATPGFTVRPA